MVPREKALLLLQALLLLLLRLLLRQQLVQQQAFRLLRLSAAVAAVLCGASTSLSHLLEGPPPLLGKGYPCGAPETLSRGPPEKANASTQRIASDDPSSWG